jgi:glycosyltransferase involved in cell wall biosynthesis
MATPGITILMPVYNGEKYLAGAVESILGQTFENFEFLIFDDGSTDRTLEILKRQPDKRIKLIENKENLGIARNLNRGIALAKGKYIARMDADDISLPTRLEEQLKFMETNRHIAVCGTWIKFIGREVKWVENNILKDPSNPEEIRCRFLFNCVLKHPSVIMRKDVLHQEGYLYNEKINRAEDYDMWVRISKKYKLSNLEKVLLKYRVHDESISRVHKKVNVEQCSEIRKKQLKALGLKPKKKQLELHNELAKVARHEFPYQLLVDSSDWLQKIYETNKKIGVYHEQILLKVLAQKWRNISACVSMPQWLKVKEAKK